MKRNSSAKYLRLTGIIFFILLSFSFISCTTFIDPISDISDSDKSNDTGFLVLNFNDDSDYIYKMSINNLDNEKSYLFCLVQSEDIKNKIVIFDKTIAKEKNSEKIYLTIIPLKAGNYQFTGVSRTRPFSKGMEIYPFSGKTMKIQPGKATYIGKITPDLMMLLTFVKCDFTVVDNSAEDLADLNGKIEVVKQITNLK